MTDPSPHAFAPATADATAHKGRVREQVAGGAEVLRDPAHHRSLTVAQWRDLVAASGSSSRTSASSRRRIPAPAG